MTESATPAESSPEKMWTDSTLARDTRTSAENAPIFRCFPAAGLTGRNAEDCYTFEGFASSDHDIHTAYYYLYKRKRLVLKEETTWS